VWALAFAIGLVSACSQESTTPTASSPITTPSSPANPAVTPPLPGMLQMAMPADVIDILSTAFGLVPYGYHGVDHAADGHSGWDIELRFGSAVRAAADGQVQSVASDPALLGRTTVKIETIINDHHYTLVYGNLASVIDDITEGASVRRGQPLGTAGVVSTTLAGTTTTYSMVHFQVDDFEYYREIPEPNAVGLEIFLTADGKQAFDRLWSTAWYPQELTEPFPANPRAARFPLVRVWRRETGLGPMGITFTRRSLRDIDYEFEILAESGTVVETGRAVVAFGRPFLSMDLISPTGTRLGLYDMIDDRMRLALGSPGASRPVNLSDASVYRTARPPASN
jgi:murein DD-endopeptidase MepM/ murein hydrolase activator NlpD